jgi:type III pantothenate kinase
LSTARRSAATRPRRSAAKAAFKGSVLLVDIGNTRIKWAQLRDGRLGRQFAEPFAGWKAKDFARRVFGLPASGAGSGHRAKRSSRKGGVSVGGDIDRVIVSSVAGARVNKVFTEAARHAHGPKPEFVASQREAGGVSTAYVEPWRLGVDRFVMAIGAHQLAKGRAACVISIGTALTIDLVDARGRHRGGAIVPAPPLMVDSLLTKTVGIRRRAGGVDGSASSGSSGEGEGGDGEGGGARGSSRSIFARTTREAIEEGALLAAAAAVDRGIEEARRAVGHSPVVLLTGGGAGSVAPLIQRPYWSVPDLVLQGLAVLANEGRPPSRES